MRLASRMSALLALTALASAAYAQDIIGDAEYPVEGLLRRRQYRRCVESYLLELGAWSRHQE